MLVGRVGRDRHLIRGGTDTGTQPELVSLASPGLVPDGWSRPCLQGISDDGRLRFGGAVNPDGQQQSWLLHLIEHCTDP
jgi:hypothetical protein